MLFTEGSAENNELTCLGDNIKRGVQEQLVHGVSGAQKAYLAARILEQIKRPALFLTSHLQQAETVAEDLATFLPGRSVLTFPPAEVLPYEYYAESPELTAERLAVLSALVHKEDVLVVAPIAALSRRLPPPKVFRERGFLLRPGNQVERDDVLARLMELGYEPLEEIPPPETLGQLLLYILVIAVTPGVCEEVIFRGAVLPSVEQHGMVPALLFSSLLFGMMHMSLLSFFSTFVLGLMFGLVVIKTGSIYGGMLFHTLNNLIAVFSMYYSNRFEMDTQIAGSEDAVALAWLAITGLSFAAMIGGLFLLQRQSRVNPLLPSRRGFLPRGWINWASVLIAIIFIGAVAFELLLGFGFFDFLETLPAPQ